MTLTRSEPDAVSAIAVLAIQLGALIRDQLDHGGLASTRRPEQGGTLVRVLVVHTRSLLQQDLRRLHMPFTRRHHQGSPTQLGVGIDVGPLGKKIGDHLGMTAGGGEEEGSPTRVVRFLDVGAGVFQSPDHRHIPPFGGAHYGRSSCGVLGPDLSPLLQKEFHHRRLSLGGCQSQRPLAPPALAIQRPSQSQEGVHGLDVPLSYGIHQSRLSVRVSPGQVGATRHQGLNRACMPLLRRPDQEGLAAIDAVGIGALHDEVFHVGSLAGRHRILHLPSDVGGAAHRNQ